MFDSSNPYRRKCSLVANESIPPHLRRAPSPPHTKTECLVHQFLADQRNAKQRLPTHGNRHHDHVETSHVHHKHAGTATCEAEDISSDAGLDRSVDPKNGHGHGHGHSKRHVEHTPEADGDDNHVDNNEEVKDGKATELYSPIVSDLHTASPANAEQQPQHDEAEYDSNASTSSANPHAGQLDEKQWRQAMVEGMAPSPLPRSPSQLDRRCSAPEDAPNSRLLTKKQLSEMAWGVRELSRRLGSMRLRFRVKTIFVLTKIYDPELIAKTRELCRWLLDRERDVRYTVYVDRELKENRRFDVKGLVEEVRRDFVASGEVSEEASWDVKKRLRFWDESMCRSKPHTFDFVITLGGDGTVLYASWLFQRIVPPVLSFALGSLGFLTKFDFEDYQKTLRNVFSEGGDS